MSATAELSSLAATIEEVARRAALIADDYAAADRDDLVAELHEVERSLGAAVRRLTRLQSAPGA